MDNNKLIMKLMNFDDEDTSTGYNSVAGPADDGLPERIREFVDMFNSTNTRWVTNDLLELVDGLRHYTIDGLFGEVAVVMIDGLYNVILKTKWRLLSKNWYMAIGNFSYDNVGVMISPGNWNFLNIDDKIVFPGKSFEDVKKEQHGVYPVKISAGWNYIKSDGKFISKEFFKDEGSFISVPCLNDDCYSVVHNFSGKKTFIDIDGNLIQPVQWWDGASFLNKECQMIVCIIGKRGAHNWYKLERHHVSGKGFYFTVGKQIKGLSVLHL